MFVVMIISAICGGVKYDFDAKYGFSVENFFSWYNTGMPGWGIHLEVGERLSKKLKFAGEDKELFLLGCILPDINNGYVNKVRVQMGHGETHWAFNQKSSLNFFVRNKRAACCEANKIEGIDVNEEEIANIEEIIGDKRLNEQSRTHEYKFYTEERLDEVMDEMIESFTGDYL